MLVGCGSNSISSGHFVSPIGFQAAPSPLVGAWTGKSKVSTSNGLMGMAMAIAGAQLEGPSTLTLNPNGKGYLKVAKTAERPIEWSQDGTKLVLTNVAKYSAKTTPEKSDPVVATLSDDAKMMTIDLGQVTVTLAKQPGK